MTKYVYFFGAGRAEGSSVMRNLLGGKGCELAEMTNLGIPVPPGFTITTQAWVHSQRAGGKWPDGLWEQILEHLEPVEQAADARFGDRERPLLVSVRSGARVSMPGMMETILNLGLNDATVEGLAARSGKERFAWDCYRRFITMFSVVVLDIKREVFDASFDAIKARLGVTADVDIPVGELRKLVQIYQDEIATRTGAPFPQDVREQLRLAIDAVFGSWFAKKATEYRRIHGIPEDWGTAVTVMAMVFGNLGDASGTGVGFTRDPRTGEARFYAEFLPNAQGEDVVAGIRTPLPIEALHERMPEIYDELLAIATRLERHYKDMQDIEFTIQEGTLYLLQTRGGKRSARAAVRVAVDLEREHVIDQHTAILRVKPPEVNEAIRPVFDDREKAAAMAAGRLLGRGLAAAPGAAVGRVVFDADRAVEWAKNGQHVILVRPETSPEDVAGMYAADGIVTSRGGRTSHAAVVAVGMGKACVVGAADLSIDETRRQFEVGGRTVLEGDVISVDGGTGEVIVDAITTVAGQLGEEMKTLLGWADFYRRNGGLGVRANADTPEDAERAREFGAEGIGLVRTEHMFFAPDRIPVVREMIMASNQATRRAALERLRPIQRQDFVGIFRAMDGLPVTIRLLDPPLHEFLPNWKEFKEMVAEKSRLETLGSEPDEQLRLGEMIEAVERLREANPMLGHRGCRLGITHPEIYGMQVRAIMEAACTVAEQGVRVEPEIMIPLTGTVGEMKETFEQTRRVADGVIAEMGVSVAYLVGTMIEVPRAALIAQKIADHAEFFSFGTNDLTQLTFGYSRDDVARFLPKYLDMGLLPADPFSVLDQEGVGELIALGIDRGRRRRPDLKVGICGEHGGEASSVEFCYKVGMNYVSCSPYLIPGARLAAAQARIRDRVAGGVDHR
ncbi:MAG TPA: pyruvate, phosphate dikinase [Methylomirabilota bacterium]|jgi:pyruvate,orthophosphate dikinase|nr:pyruvate, phosphate dikinase [Methylomirabilota bacterium]